MTRIFGNFIERKDERFEYLKIGFSPTSIPIQQRWRNNGLSADFLADYLTTFFPGDDSAAPAHHTEIKGAVSYVANELLENAIKFSYAPSQHTVSIELYLEADAISLYVMNSIDPHAVESFQSFLQRLLTEDTNDLYVELLTRNAEDSGVDQSGLGYLTMLNDYGATLAWQFEPSLQAPDVLTVTTMARIAV